MYHNGSLWEDVVVLVLSSSSWFSSYLFCASVGIMGASSGFYLNLRKSVPSMFMGAWLGLVSYTYFFCVLGTLLCIHVSFLFFDPCCV